MKKNHMKTQKEALEQKCLAISAWMNKRGHARLLEDEKAFKRADEIIDQYLMELKGLIIEQDVWTE